MEMALFADCIAAVANEADSLTTSYKLTERCR